jgi:hypothetical protein
MASFIASAFAFGVALCPAAATTVFFWLVGNVEDRMGLDIHTHNLIFLWDFISIWVQHSVHAHRKTRMEFSIFSPSCASSKELKKTKNTILLLFLEVLLNHHHLERTGQLFGASFSSTETTPDFLVCLAKSLTKEPCPCVDHTSGC